MRRSRQRSELPDDGEVELAALADGSLAPERRAPLEARVAESPDLRELLAEQERALTLVHGASATVAAPAGLRNRVEARRGSRRRARPQRLVLAGGLAAALATALALFLALPGGGRAPSLEAAAQLSVRAATGPAPALQSGRPKLLAQSVDGVPFPNWQKKFRWRATGLRTDRLAGRGTTTVFYGKQGHRLGYTIVGGAALPVPEEAVLVDRGGTKLHVFALDGRTVVTWRRGGRTCVLSGPGVERDVLLKLASWKGKGAVPF